MPLDSPRSVPPAHDPNPDAVLLDAYSHAVTSAVDAVAPAVAHVRVERDGGQRAPGRAS